MKRISPAPSRKSGQRPSISHDGHVDLESGVALRMRRQSVDAGVPLQLQSGAATAGDIPTLHVLELDDLTTGQISAIADPLILAIKGSSGGVGGAIEAWSLQELPRADSEEILLHSSYMRKGELVNWITSIDFDSSVIFKSATCLPSTISGTSTDMPHSFLFGRLRKKVAWFKDDEAMASVEEKLTALENQLKARQEAEASEALLRQESLSAAATPSAVSLRRRPDPDGSQ